MGLQNTRKSNYSEWYQDIIKAADLAENSLTRGCMVIKPWGFGLWEHIQKNLDGKIKETGHDNYYFPIFIPLSLFQKEAEHVEGFAKEMAVVTHSRLINENGKLIPASPLEEPLVVRPTSETIIAESFSKWVNSYRDLPVLMNQWANVVRWEMRPRIFLRTCEFLWQEGHTAHSSEAEAIEETIKMLEVYRVISEEYMAMPVIVGEKCESERFPGAKNTYCIESMMQDGRALQAGTSHYLGQNFAKSANITFQNKNNEQEYAYTTSWGVSTRLIGGLIMTHSDDEGLRTPPRIAPSQVVIVPITRDESDVEAVNAYATKLKKSLEANQAFGEKIRVKLDARDKAPIDKRWEWIRKGAPLVIEVGPKDIEKNSVAVNIRNKFDDKGRIAKEFIAFDEFIANAGSMLENMQKEMFEAAKSLLDNNIREDISTWEEFQAYFKPKNAFLDDSKSTPAFVKAKWCGDAETEEKLKELAVTIRCIPLQQSGTTGKCVITGKDATMDVIFARSY